MYYLLVNSLHGSQGSYTGCITLYMVHKEVIHPVNSLDELTRMYYFLVNSLQRVNKDSFTSL